ncbi:MAG: hypothetical protein WBO09_08195 [Methylocystis silviterrae]|uniref:hypothetical protein n=1 Tax=Methylocystis silviterrae TaxID=2743612 RepID=UPI003C795CFA
MGYSQDTIISVNAANVFAGILDGLLIAEGWTLVEELLPTGTNTPTTRVYKSAGLTNQCGYDWYLALMYKQVGTEAQVRILGGGAYDSGTHIMTQIPAGLQPVTPSSGATQYADPVTGDLWGGYNVNIATNTAIQVISLRSGSIAQSWPFFSVIVPSSAFGYWMSVTLDHVAVFTTIPGSYVVGTLDVDPAWTALVPGDFGNGVAVNPVVAYVQNAAPNSTQYQGISATAIGVPGTQGNTNQLAPRASRATPIGSPLPILDGSYLPAYAWRDAWYLVSLNFSNNRSAGGTPAFDHPVMGQGIHIGNSIDWYMVYGGAIGDTVVIAGATYVLSGLLTGSTSDDTPTAAYIAVLVE